MNEGIDWHHVIRGTISPEEYEVVPTELEKIFRIFEKKWLANNVHRNGPIWYDYLKSMGLESITSDTSLASPLDYLLERVYSGNFDKVVVRDPDPSSGGFILMDRDFANKILVLGDLP